MNTKTNADEVKEAARSITRFFFDKGTTLDIRAPATAIYLSAVFNEAASMSADEKTLQKLKKGFLDLLTQNMDESIANKGQIEGDSDND